MSSKRFSGDWSNAHYQPHANYPYNPNAAPRPVNAAMPPAQPIQARGPPPQQAGAYSGHPPQRAPGSHRKSGSGGYPMYPAGWDKTTTAPQTAYDGQPLSGARGGSRKSYTARLQAQPGLEEQIYKSQARRPDYDDPVSPTLDPQTNGRAAYSRDPVDYKMDGRRKGSVPDRSPLQKLEVTLDDISKEEKRARVAEAEAVARDRMAKDPRRSSTRRSGDGHHRSTSAGYDSTAAPQRGKRVASAPITGASAREPEETRYYQSGPHRAVPAAVGGASQDTDRTASDERRSSSHRAYPSDEPLARPPRPAAPAKPTAPARSSNSRRLQKSPPTADVGRSGTVTGGKEQLRSDRAGDLSTNREAANKYQDPDPLPPAKAANHQMPPTQGPKYEVPPQTAAGKDAHERVNPDFAATPRGQAVPRHQHHRTRDAFFGHDEPERRYQTFSKPLDEWRSAQTASLMGNDLVLDDDGSGKDSTWWEKNSRSARRSSGAKAVQFDGPLDAEDGRQTYFQPPLYLKCGPLLRYCGIERRQSSNGSTSEVWRGSVMIVTDDTKPHTQDAPTLRLFVQPRDLLPPPPAELNVEGGQQLAPEYVDPVAGQVHMSRIGKTLYVRPVEQLQEGKDLSCVENDTGLFEERRSGSSHAINGQKDAHARSRRKVDGEKLGKYREVKAVRLHRERNTTFWRFNIEVELGRHQARIGYRINRGPSVGFWVPARGESMNIMFHSCNGFSLSVTADEFCGPDPLWRDVLNAHQTRPFHVMIGGGDQIYNDAATRDTDIFGEWCESRNPQYKHSAQFTVEMQEELEKFYCERYAMWFSQGMFGMANSQIPMVNIWDDHDLIDGFGSYPHGFMSTPVFTGVGAVSFKYYMLFQHQSLPAETEREEPSWLLGASPGPYINELSRSLFMWLGRGVAFVGLDCRTERMKDEVLSQETYDRVFARLRRELVRGDTKHLIVLLGVPVAYPRLNFLENVLTSRAMDPVKALGRLGMLGNLLNKFDGGVEILDDLDDHWTAKHHKHERNWFIQELQELAAEKSVRVTILGGDVHLAAVGQFYSNKKLGVPKDKDYRYMPNIISSAIVNSPPPELMADVLNKRNKIHHLDHNTDEDMIPLFTHDVDGKPRNNQRLLPRRNWCSIREYHPGSTPPASPALSPSEASAVPSRRGSLKLTRSLSRGRDSITRRLTKKEPAGAKPPRSYFNTPGGADRPDSRRASDPTLDGGSGVGRRGSPSRPRENNSGYFSGVPPASSSDPQPRPNVFHRVPTGLSERARLRGAGADDIDIAHHINLQHGLDIVLNLEVNQHDPAGITTPYRLLVPALDYAGDGNLSIRPRKPGLWRGLSQRIRGRRGSDATSLSYDSEFSSREHVGPGGLDGHSNHHQAPASYGAAGVSPAAPTAHHATAALPPRQSAQYRRSGGYDGTVATPPAARAATGRSTAAAAAAAPPSGKANIGPDGRPVRNRFRGDVYNDEEAPSSRFADPHERRNIDDDDDDDHYSDAVEEVPRQSMGDRMRQGLGISGSSGYYGGEPATGGASGYGGYGGVEAAGKGEQKRRASWKIWK